ncbi:two-component sensor histidine kinase [Jeotgalibacillus proteolyticus]|uniref:histidine kinase n=2 Tax=Jeotgalibacillus proteolyticus TaxID=2082395 RepID=A0A2S5G713_9BACL|nr:two-component sensor histidine kinase [Jeotgalibacillus proteolyticus]PPA68776.1 two-component sensor histidine kinase [Jeotgalibacillus proteolyticus]
MRWGAGMSKLSLKISLYYLFGITIILVVCLFIMHNLLVDQQVNNKLENLHQRGDSHRDVLSESMDQQTIDHVVMMEEKAMTDVVIINKNGQVAGASNQADEHLSEGWEITEEGVAEDDWRNEPFLASISLIDGGGSVIMLEPTAQVQSLISKLNRHFLIAALLLGCFLVLSLYFLSHLIIKPLLSIRLAAGKLSEGLVITVPETKRSDEIGELARAITKISGDLHQIQRTRKAFLTSIAHELRTPITYIKGYAGLFKKEDSAYGEIIYDESQRLHKLIEDLFELARLEEHSFTIEPERTEMTSFIMGITERLQLVFNEKQIHLLIHASIPFYKQIDQRRFEQVITNLMDNSLKYTPSGKKVQIAVTKEQIVLTDEGPGVKEDALPFLFDRFYRVDTSRNRKTGGTGIGLAIAKEITEAHGGKIWAENTGSGLSIVIDLKGVSS